MARMLNPLPQIADYLGRVERVAPVARAHADWSEQNARPAEAFVDALRTSGLLRMLVPSDVGGGELSPWVIGPVLEAMSRVDGSAGWTLALSQGLLTQFLPKSRYREMFGDGRATVAGSLNPVGARAEVVDGGYRYSGKGTYVSGCTHARWMMAAAIVTETHYAAPNEAALDL